MQTEPSIKPKIKQIDKENVGSTEINSGHSTDIIRENTPNTSIQTISETSTNVESNSLHTSDKRIDKENTTNTTTLTSTQSTTETSIPHTSSEGLGNPASMKSNKPIKDNGSDTDEEDYKNIMKEYETATDSRSSTRVNKVILDTESADERSYKNIMKDINESETKDARSSVNIQKQSTYIKEENISNSTNQTTVQTTSEPIPRPEVVSKDNQIDKEIDKQLLSRETINDSISDYKEMEKVLPVRTTSDTTMQHTNSQDIDDMLTDMNTTVNNRKIVYRLDPLTKQSRYKDDIRVSNESVVTDKENSDSAYDKEANFKDDTQSNTNEVNYESAHERQSYVKNSSRLTEAEAYKNYRKFMRRDRSAESENKSSNTPEDETGPSIGEKMKNKLHEMKASISPEQNISSKESTPTTSKNIVNNSEGELNANDRTSLENFRKFTIKESDSDSEDEIKSDPLPKKPEFHDRLDNETGSIIIEKVTNKLHSMTAYIKSNVQDVKEYVSSAAYSSKESRPDYMQSNIQSTIQGTSQSNIRSAIPSDIQSSSGAYTQYTKYTSRYR